MYSHTRLEYEYMDSDGTKFYSLMEKLILSHKRYDIVVPKNFITKHKTRHEIVFQHLINERTISNLQASWIYLYAMKCDNIPLFTRFKKFIISLKYLI